jgi:hypothetical protein
MESDMAGRYRFVERLRSDSAEAAEWEFEYSFARLDYLSPNILTLCGIDIQADGGDSTTRFR